MMKKLAVFGGTFNPIHNGHMAMARAAAKAIDADKVLLIPTASPPHKIAKGDVGAQHRLNMLIAAVNGERLFEISDIELKRGGKSYTSDTIAQLKDIYRDRELYLLMGADMFLSLETWHEYEYILQNAVIVTFARDDSGESELCGYAERLIRLYGCRQPVIVSAERIDISSTDVRRIISQGGDASEYVPAAVMDYINKNNLYR